MTYPVSSSPVGNMASLPKLSLFLRRGHLACGGSAIHKKPHVHKNCSIKYHCYLFFSSRFGFFFTFFRSAKPEKQFPARFGSRFAQLILIGKKQRSPLQYLINQVAGCTCIKDMHLRVAEHSLAQSVVFPERRCHQMIPL